MGHYVGSGCTNRQSGLPVNNPRPSTARGKRRHEARNDGQKKRAEAIWEGPRSTKLSRYQKVLGLHGY